MNTAENRQRVLYVDDEADIRGIVEYALEDESDMELKMCASGHDAVECVTDFKPHIILLDVMMPGMDGPTTLKKFRELAETENTPVIFVTAKVQPHEVQHFISLGAVDVIAKPFEPMELAKQIRRHFRSEVPEEPEKKRDKFNALCESYKAELPGRILSIKSEWQQAQKQERPHEHLSIMHRLIHSISGSAQSFGFRALSELARNIEQTILSVIEREASLRDNLVQQIGAQLGEMDNLVAAGPDKDHISVEPTGKKPLSSGSRLIYLVEDDAPLADIIRSQLQIHDWDVRIFTDATSARQALGKQLPAAIIADLCLPEGKYAGSKLLQKFQPLSEMHIPRIVISSMWNWESRLAAARAGVDVYLTKPLDLSTLVDQLSRLTETQNKEPYRVMIVEDTVALANYYAQVLEDAGMQVKIVTDPTRLLDALGDFHPELILMDLYMPGCSGVEAARVVRQDSRFLSVPIVFLSAETERQRQLGAMRTGGDDFLIKPISNFDLVAAVTLRAERFRTLSNVIRQDSLTGLLNHVSFKLHLEQEFARAQRFGSLLSFAMIDVDRFKSVNDNYGHPMGDRVLKSVAHMLMTRLRKSDVIGRYGGEEFVVLMPDTRVEDALTVLNSLREQFAKVRFLSDGREFNCTFSAGLGSAPPYTNMDTFIQLTDNALYQAKQSGRNRICLAAAQEPVSTVGRGR